MESQIVIKVDNNNTNERISPRFERQIEQPVNLRQIISRQSTNEQECSICMENRKATLRQFSSCRHKFCRSCIEAHVLNKIGEGATSIYCPQNGCTERLMESSAVYPELQDQTKRLFKKRDGFNFILNNPEYQLCKKEECFGMFRISNNKQENICDTCKALHCQKCYDLQHTGVCTQALANFLKGKELLRQCRMCRNIIEKNEGCNHMKCLCGHEFCYFCEGDFLAGHACSKRNYSTYESLHWSLLHDQLRPFQFRCLNLRKIYRFFQLIPQDNPIKSALKFITFIILIYPLLLVLATIIFTVVLLCFTLVLIFLLIFIYPFISITRDMVGETVQHKIGQRSKIMALIIVILFYPILFIHTTILSFQWMFRWMKGRYNNDTNFNRNLMEDAVSHFGVTFFMPCFII